MFYENLLESDLSYSFLDSIEKEFSDSASCDFVSATGNGRDEVLKIASHFGIDDINLIKPGIGEATRVLLRRLPWKILVDKRFASSPQLAHLLKLAEEKGVPVEEYNLEHYKCCGIIKKLADA